MHTPEIQDKEGEDLPVRSQERCTQKVGHPPFLQRACNVTVGEEKRRTLLRLFLICELANPENNKTGMLWLVVFSLSRKPNAILKITLARRKTCTEAARRSFPGDTSFTQGGFWLANEELLTRENDSYRLHKAISLSFIFPNFQPPPITTPSLSPLRHLPTFYLLVPLLQLHPLPDSAVSAVLLCTDPTVYLTLLSWLTLAFSVCGYK